MVKKNPLKPLAFLTSSKLFSFKVLGGLLVLSVAGYVLTQSVLLAFASFALIVLLFFSDFSLDKTWKQNLLELFYALVFAIAAWFALGFVLQTDSPMNVVTSCSMLPNLQRGDLVFIRGGVENVPSLNASFSDLGSVQVHKSVCFAGTQPWPCTDYAIVANQTVFENRSNDIIVFDPKPTGPGLLIHMAFAKINTEDGAFFLTKGDNNPVLDQENHRFYFVSEKDVKGRVFLTIPFVGYLKLLLFLQFEVPAGCDSVLEKAEPPSQ
ncbi:MAG: hypothetical protein V1717_00805 [Candidatus Micrarchaeota archaeon]